MNYANDLKKKSFDFIFDRMSKDEMCEFENFLIKNTHQKAAFDGFIAILASCDWNETKAEHLLVEADNFINKNAKHVFESCFLDYVSKKTIPLGEKENPVLFKKVGRQLKNTNHSKVLPLF